jgi:cytochrome c oxidase subunit II
MRKHSPWQTRVWRLCVVLCSGLGAAGCSRQSLLADHSKSTHDVGLLWWWMLGAAVIVFFGAVALLFVAFLRRRVPGLPIVGEREGVAQALVLLFGIGIPVVALVALFAVADIYLVNATAAPAADTTAMTVDVIGHQWWWEVRYDGGKAITANEIHIPVRTRVNVVATTADVIHSFWVPALNGKIDMIPGRANRELLDASQPGVYRGQCSQYCGLQHAHMALLVYAQPMTKFKAWLANQEKPAVTPTGASAVRGRADFMNDQCSSCHLIAGTPARGFIGPALTHLATRSTLASNTIPNTPGWLARWIHNPQAIKPGDRMPDLGLPRRQVRDLVAYLDELK